MSYCLEKGGKHVEPPHFAEICRTSAHFTKHTCRECAEIC